MLSAPQSVLDTNFKILRALRLLFFSILIWGRKVSLLSKRRPTNFVSVTIFIGELHNFISGSGWSPLLLQMCIPTVFELENLNPFSIAHVRTIRSLVQGRIHKLKNCVNSRPKSVFKDQEAVKCLSSLHDKYVIVPVDKASNNIVFVCKSYYFECLIKELGINSNTSSNTTYKPTSFDKDEILANHRSFMTSLNIPSGKESEDLPYLYWIPKLHKTPYKERYIAGSSTCSTKELSIHLTKILSAVKEGQQKYCETVYSRSGINHMWILKNSKDLLDNLKSRSFSQVSSIKTFDFSTL